MSSNERIGDSTETAGH